MERYFIENMRPRRVHPFTHISIIVLLWLFLFSVRGFSQDMGLRGQLSSWLTGSFEKKTQPLLGFRFIPEFTLSYGEKTVVDMDAAFNAYGTMDFNPETNTPYGLKIKPYRGWVRLTIPQFEVRLGLQKINFGSASLLRPLMLFDSIDPRDPLQITDGVYALLLRYYFLSNTNIWFWTLYGNDKTRGWDVFPSAKKSPEFGGRIQVPLFNGELALTYHRRRINLDAVLPSRPGTTLPDASENRYGLDGKWDLGVGLWFEGLLSKKNTNLIPEVWRRSINIGMDYTFGMGNGLAFLAEYFTITNSTSAFGRGQSARIISVLLRYPLSILDDVSGIFYYDMEQKNFYRYISWQRTYDRWKFGVIGFWNPKNVQIYRAQEGNNLFSGAGFQLLVTYNY